jgi:hypothetical protein
MKKINGHWVFTQIGDGVVGYGRILREMVHEKSVLPLSIEHLFIYNASQDLVVQRKARAPELSQISTSLKASYDFVNRIIHT